MKFFSIDLETSRLEPRSPDAILMASWVFEDTYKPTPLRELPHFTCLIDQGPSVTGSATALAMNSWILLAVEQSFRLRGLETTDDIEAALDRVSRNWANCGIPAATVKRAVLALTKYPVCNMKEFISQSIDFIRTHVPEGPVNVAGKNAASFDIPFLPLELRKIFRHRVVDPGSMFVDWGSDSALPDLNTVLKRSGCESDGVSHDALDDALDVVAVLRTTYNRKMFGSDK